MTLLWLCCQYNNRVPRRGEVVVAGRLLDRCCCCCPAKWNDEFPEINRWNWQFKIFNCIGIQSLTISWTGDLLWPAHTNPVNCNYRSAGVIREGVSLRPLLFVIRSNVCVESCFWWTRHCYFGWIIIPREVSLFVEGPPPNVNFHGIFIVMSN